MKITIPKKELKDALIKMSKVIYGKTNLPILGAVKITGTDSGVTVTGTNLEETLTCMIIDGSEGGGSFIIDLKELKDYLKNGGTSTSVQFEDVGNKIAGISHAGNVPVIRQFHSFPLDNWPVLPPLPLKRNQINESVFKRIRKAIPSVSKDKTRRMLNGVLLEPDAVVATSGKELVKLCCKIGIEDAAVIPVTKFLNSAYFTAPEGRISVEESEDIKYCTFITESWCYTVKCPIGTYPNYQQVIPTKSICSLELSSADIEYLRKEIPFLETSDDHEAIHLYSDDQSTMILPEKMTGKVLKVRGIFKGSRAVTVSVNRNLLMRALDLGFSKLNFMSTDGFDPVIAKDNKGLFVFMPLRNADSAGIREAVAGFRMKGQEETPLPEKQVVEQSQPNKERLKDCANKNKTVQTLSEKEDKMAEEIKNTQSGFKVVEGSSKDEFEALLESINEMRTQSKAVYDMTGTLAKKVKDCQRVQRTKEREFKHTRELLGKLKKVSGF